MILFQTLFAFLIPFITFLLRPCSSLTQNGYYILDLETTDLTSEIADWTISTPISSAKTYTTLPWTTMPARIILGGPNILGPSGASTANEYFSRTYTDLEDHTYVSFTLIMWYFDDWSSRESLPGVKFVIDGVVLSGPSVSFTNDFWSYEGGDPAVTDSGFDHIMAGIAHTGNSMTFEIVSLITLSLSSYSGPSPSLCHRSEEIALHSNFDLKYSQCSCPLGKALSGTTCTDCAIGCANCFGKFISQCFQCDTGLLWTGSQCCHPRCSFCEGVTQNECYDCNPGNYNYGNGTCQEDCPWPFYNETAADDQIMCYKPCADGEYFFAFNETCFQECEEPLVIDIDLSNNILYCSNPCDPDLYYTFTNGSCFTDCPSLLDFRIVPGIKFCYNPCSNPATDYIFTNKTCLASCPPPLFKLEEPDVNYCYNPCPSPVLEYLFPNASCFTDCPSPLLNRSEPGVNYCYNPCDDPITDYLYTNGTCSQLCVSPLASRSEPDVLYCFNPCLNPTTDYLFTNQTCATYCPYPLAYRKEPMANYCFNPCANPAVDYLYWNQTCSTECVYPLANRQEPDVRYCFNPCAVTDYLFQNQSCFSTCPYPLAYRIEPGVQFCFNPCTNPTVDYLYWNQTCSTLCVIPLISRTEPNVMYCFNPCPTASLFLYLNRTCFATCPLPLASRSEPGVKYCWNPCNFPLTEYLHTNQSCIDKCPYPLAFRVEPDVMYCYNPCATSDYLFWNQTCFSTCPWPLAYRFEPNVKYCFNPCTNPTTELLYYNRSCLTTCPFPLAHRTEPGVKYCFNPCQYPGAYLYENQTCQDTCWTPLVTRNEPDVAYCYPPCQAPNIYWYINETCRPTCPDPYVQLTYSNVLMCLSPCKNESDYFYEYEKECQETCDAPFSVKMSDSIKVCYFYIAADYATVVKVRKIDKLITTEGKISSAFMKTIAILNSNNPSSALLAGYASMFQFIRYLDIEYPPKLETLFLIANETPITMNFNVHMSSSIEEDLTDYTLPDAFEKYSIHSNFLKNTWGFLWTLFISLAIIGFFMLGLKVFKKSPKWTGILQKFIQVAKWNIPLVIICSGAIDVFFYAPVHMLAMKMNTFALVVSFFMSLSVLLATIGFILFIFKIIHSFVKVKKDTFDEYNLKEKWQGFSVLYIHFEETSLYSWGYMGCFLVRGFIYAFTIACLYKIPLMQVSIINLCNFAMLVYLIVYRPPKAVITVAHVFINEILNTMLGLLVLILAVMDHLKITGDNDRANIGEIILVVLQAFHTVGVIFTSIYLLLTLRYLYRVYRYLKACGYESLMEMLQASNPKEIESDPAFQDSNNRFFNFLEAGPRIEGGGGLGGGKKPRILRPPRKETDVITLTSPSKDNNQGISTINLATESNQLNLNLTREASSFLHPNTIDVSEQRHTSPSLSPSIPLFKPSSRFFATNIQVELAQAVEWRGMRMTEQQEQTDYSSLNTHGGETPVSGLLKPDPETPSYGGNNDDESLSKSFELGGQSQIEKKEYEISYQKEEVSASEKDESQFEEKEVSQNEEKEESSYITEKQEYRTLEKEESSYITEKQEYQMLEKDESQFENKDESQTLEKEESYITEKQEYQTLEKEEELLHMEESQNLEEVKSSIDSDQAFQRRQNLVKTYQKMRNRATKKKLQESIRSSQKSIEQEKDEEEKEEKGEEVKEKEEEDADVDVENVELPESPEEQGQRKEKNDRGKDLKEMKEKYEKKSWLDGLRKLKNKIGKDKNKDVSPS